MLRKIIISTICFIVNIAGIAGAQGQCGNLKGQWEGSYMIKPTVYGFSVGFCEYSTSMTVTRGKNGNYNAVINNTKVDSDGKAGKNCDQRVKMKAKMICEGKHIRIVAENTTAGRLDIVSKIVGDNMSSNGKFKVKHGGYNLKVNYILDVDKKDYAVLAMNDSVR